MENEIILSAKDKRNNERKARRDATVGTPNLHRVHKSMKAYNRNESKRINLNEY